MDDSTQSAAQKKTMPAWGGLVLLAIGIAAGAVGATTMVRTINLRHAYPRAVMTLMNVHVSQLKHAIYTGQCTVADSAAQLQRMNTLASTIQAAFKVPDGSPFMQAHAHLQQALDKARATPLASCQSLRAALGPINDACQSCHSKFR